MSGLEISLYDGSVRYVHKDGTSDVLPLSLARDEALTEREEKQAERFAPIGSPQGPRRRFVLVGNLTADMVRP